MTVTALRVRVEPAELTTAVATAVANGARFAGLLATANDDGSTLLRAVLAGPDLLATLETRLPPGQSSYPALTPTVPGASWYEREIHDLFGLDPVGHPRLDPLVLPRLQPAQGEGPRPGRTAVSTDPIAPEPAGLPSVVTGEGMFTIPYGPVRSGVFESVEYLVETFGEDIPHVRVRVYHKHRGVDTRFQGLEPNDAVFLAERVEGTTSVAHAVAYSRAVEAMAGVEVPRGAELVRLVHAELERIANHLESVARHSEAASQAVAYARMTLYKERVMRLRARLCGHRFGRGVVVPGGVSRPPLVDIATVSDDVRRLERDITRDLKALMATPSFLDRLRGTGILPVEIVAEHGALGPVGRGSGLSADVRADRPYGAYASLGFRPVEAVENGDALARQRVRVDEIRMSLGLVEAALGELEVLVVSAVGAAWKIETRLADGVGLASVEAPSGELIYLVEADRGRLMRVKPRCPSFHNLALFPTAFRGDILTDFAFIEASFGLSIAGAAG